MNKNNGPVALSFVDGNLRIALKKRASARQQVERSIEGNGIVYALYEVLEHYTQNGIFKFVAGRHSQMAARGPALAIPDEYVVDDHENLVYLHRLYSYDEINIADPLTVLLRQGFVDFKSHILCETKPRTWINLRLALYNRIYNKEEFIKDVVCATECTDGQMLIEILPDGTSRGFWTADLHEPHSMPGSIYVVVKGIDSLTYDWILNSDIVRDSHKPTSGDYEKTPGLRAAINERLRQARLETASERRRDAIIETFNAVEEQD